MKVYRRYRCDFGHQWIIQREPGEAEHLEDVNCHEGHPAVTCNEEEPADEVQVVFRPAARVVDKVKGQLGFEGRYWLVLLDRAGAELCSSTAHYSWEEAIRLAEFFRGKNADRALQWWNRRSP